MTIKLNKAINEKETIKQLIKQSIVNPAYELECVIGGNYNLGSIINHQQFRKIISRISGKSEYQTKNPEDRLVISFPRDTKFAGVRVIISGFGSINYYCINEKLEGIIQNVVFQDKQYASEKVNKHIVSQYNLRFNQKVEKHLDTDSALIRELLRDWQDVPKIFRYKKVYSHITEPDMAFAIDCSIVRSSGFEDRELTVKEVIAQDMFNNVIKPADEKATFGDWWKRISKTADAKVKVRNVNIYYKNIKESKVFENDFIYEVEVEYLADHKHIMSKNPAHANRKTLRQQYVDSEDKEAFVTNIFAAFFRQIGIVLQCVQDSFHIMNNEEVLNVLQSYSRLTGVKKGVDNLFFGPLPVDLDNNKMIQYPDTVYENMNRVYENGNIVLDYCVTDKSDGSRALLYVNGEGRVYLIGRDGVAVVKDTGLNIPGYENSVFDGEYIEFDKDGQFFNKYYVFDAYIVRGNNIMKQPFGRGKDSGRLWEITRFTETVIAGYGVRSDTDKDKYIFRIDKKNFLFGGSSQVPVHMRNAATYSLIFKQCDNILNRMNREFGGYLEEGHLFSYKTDGLIFTPVELGVYQSSLENDVPGSVLVSSRKWSLLYKWKNAKMLSFDFRVEFPTNNIKVKGPGSNNKSNERNYMYIGSNKYARGILRARNYDSHVWLVKEHSGEAVQASVGVGKSAERIESQISSLLLNDNLSLYNMPDEIPFMTANPYLGTRDLDGNIVSQAHECLLPTSGQDVKCVNGDVIYDGNVVEFIYDSSQEIPGMRWIPLKVRYGKTPNALNTCLDIWNLIHNPVTQDTISNGLHMDASSQLTDINYYLHGKHMLSYGLKKFNNFVKGWVLDRFMHSLTNPRVLDLGCGKMGDFFKFVQQGTGTLVGIDINPDNLNNKLDGAGSRILNSVNTNPRVKALANRTLLILGDVSKNIADGSAARDELGKYYLDVLYGRHKTSPTFNGKHAKLFNVGTEGFHVVVSMYVIHYCMDTEDRLNGYLENVSQNLRDQGYFIGTCIDGNLVLDELNNNGGRSIGKLNGHIIWSIDRDDMDVESGVMYDESMNSLPGIRSLEYNTSMPHLIGVGNKVNMYFETMNMISRENLVDINYLAHKAKEYGLKLVESRLFTETPGSLLDEWLSLDNSNVSQPGSHSRTRDSSEPNIAQMVTEIRKESALNRWAEFQRYFVFQKVPNA